MIRLATGSLLGAIALAYAPAALAGPEAYRGGLKMCATLAQHYGAAYVYAARLPLRDREVLFDTVKEQQASDRMQAAARGADATESYVNSVQHFVQRTATLLAIEEPNLSAAAAQGRLFDQCSVQVRGLLELPGS